MAKNRAHTWPRFDGSACCHRLAALPLLVVAVDDDVDVDERQHSCAPAHPSLSGML